MTVYADILILLNFLTDYFLLSVSARLIHKNPHIGRMLLGSGIGGVASLYIFAPSLGIAAELAFKTAVCLFMTLSVFGFGGFKGFLRNAGILFLVTCVYGGIMTAVWYIFKPNGMTVVNSVVYFNISPTVLIISSVAFYILYIIFSAVFSRSAECAEHCEITISAEGKSITVTGIVDTGNSVEDILGNSEIIIADKTCAESLFGDINPLHNGNVKSRYRILPCKTVSGGGTLDGFRCDFAFVRDAERSVRLERPVLAVSKTPIRDDYSAIVNPRIFL